MHDEVIGADAGVTEGGGTLADSPREEPLKTVPLHPRHRVADFCCKKSARVDAFLHNDAVRYDTENYARTFVIEDPSDDGRVWGYYTLSATVLRRSEVSTQDQKKIKIVGIPTPLILLGYMGRCQSAPVTLGGGLVIDAARRAYRNRDIAAWGLLLQAEEANAKLVSWYKDIGFTLTKDQSDKMAGTMYAPWKRLIPELRKPPAQVPATSGAVGV